MKKLNKTILFEIPEREESRDNPKMLRVLVSDEFTRVDFGYSAIWYYNKGGWIRIAEDTFIQDAESGKEYKLIQADGIPIAPTQHYFESTKDWQFFSLLFEPMPFMDCVINIIEAREPDANDFNYYGIEMNINDGFRIREEVVF